MKLLTANRQQTTTDNSVIIAVDEQTTKQDGTVAHQPIGRLCGARKGKCQRGGNKAGGILQFIGSRSCNERKLLQSGVPKTVAESIMPLALCFCRRQYDTVTAVAPAAAESRNRSKHQSLFNKTTYSIQALLLLVVY